MNGIDRSARVIRSSVGEGAEIRENCTLHDSSIMDLLAAYAPNFRGKAIQWHIQDPADKSIKKTRIARDMVNKEVLGLIKEINSGR